jgi:hypothetical protein
MNSHHTPGPWTVDSGIDGAVVHADVTIANIPDEAIAWKANARLISCAPEMLDALTRLLNEIESICAHGAGATRDELLERLHMDWDGRLRAARAAISKATGGGL